MPTAMGSQCRLLRHFDETETEADSDFEVAVVCPVNHSDSAAKMQSAMFVSRSCLPTAASGIPAVVAADAVR